MNICHRGYGCMGEKAQDLGSVAEHKPCWLGKMFTSGNGHETHTPHGPVVTDDERNVWHALKYCSSKWVNRPPASYASRSLFRKVSSQMPSHTY
jgi:hypothetical protein